MIPEPDKDGLVTLQLSPGSTVRLSPENVFTEEQFLSLLRERFGEHAGDFAFVCPNCGDVASGEDFKTALLAHPRNKRDGRLVTAPDIMGQQCIGRTLGALSRIGKYAGRGCDWAAGGLFSGPIYVERINEDGEAKGWMPCFRPAPAANVVNLG